LFQLDEPTILSHSDVSLLRALDCVFSVDWSNVNGFNALNVCSLISVTQILQNVMVLIRKFCC